jgi:hypothetical protein
LVSFSRSAQAGRKTVWNFTSTWQTEAFKFRPFDVKENKYLGVDFALSRAHASFSEDSHD